VLDVEGGAGHDAAQGAGSQGPATQVESSDHPVESRPVAPPRPPGSGPSRGAPEGAGASSLGPWRHACPSSP
jgi:hypothetical protein